MGDDGDIPYIINTGKRIWHGKCESCSIVIFNRLHFHRIELHIRVDNEPSVRLAERAGFSLNARERRFH